MAFIHRSNKIIPSVDVQNSIKHMQQQAQAYRLKQKIEQDIQKTMQFLKTKGHAITFERRYTDVQRQVDKMIAARDFTCLEDLTEQTRKLDFNTRAVKRKVDGRKIQWVDHDQFGDKREIAWQVAKKVAVDMQQLVTAIDSFPKDSLNHVNYHAWLVNYDRQVKDCCKNGNFRSLRRLNVDVDTVLDYMRAQVDFH